MSAYKKIKCNIVDKDTLIKALKTIGFDPLIHEAPQNPKTPKPQNPISLDTDL